MNSAPTQSYPGHVDWDSSYRQGEWDFLGDLPETPRYAMVAGYVHKLLPHGTLLDVGCGFGALIDYLDMSRYHYSGFDLSEAAIARANVRFPNHVFSTCSVEDFVPVEDQQYDIIIFNEVLSQVRNSRDVLVRFYSFLRSGGHVVISQFQNPNPDSKGAIWSRMFEAEITANSVALLAEAESFDQQTGRRWKCYCLSHS